jgi:hypothetical protein
MNLITQGEAEVHVVQQWNREWIRDSRAPRELNSYYQQSLLSHIKIYVCSHLVAEQVCRRWWMVVCGGRVYWKR